MRFHFAKNMLDTELYRFWGGALICAVIYFVCQRLMGLTLLTMVSEPGWAQPAGLYGSIILTVLYDLRRGFKKEGFSLWGVVCGGLGAVGMWLIII